MAEYQENALRAQPLRGEAIQAALVLTAVVVAGLFATEPLFPIFLLPAILLVLAFVSFDTFVYAMVFLLPWYPLPKIELPVRDVFMLLRFVMFVGVFVIRYKDGRSLHQWLFGNKINKAVLAYALVATVSLLASPFVLKLDAFRSLVRFFSYLAMFFAVTGWIQSRAQVYKLVKLLLYSTVMVALFGLYQALIGDYTNLYLYLFEAEIPDWSGRITSFLFHFNALAGYLNLVIPFAIGYMILMKDRSSKWLGSICLCIATAALYLTGSRGGLVAYSGILLSAVVFVLLRFRPGLAILARGALMIALAAAIANLLTVTIPEQQTITRLEEVDDFTTLSRLALWGTAAQMFIEHPVLGVGYGNYRALYSDFMSDVEADQMDAHSLYLQLLAETGIVGFALFLLPVILVLLRIVPLLGSFDPFYALVSLGVGGALVGVLIHGFVDFFFHVQPQFGGLFWLILALGVVVAEEARGAVALASTNRPSNRV
jgi:putative inorganic carbon (HCO3(-)) transporter